MDKVVASMLTSSNTCDALAPVPTLGRPARSTDAGTKVLIFLATVVEGR